MLASKANEYGSRHNAKFTKGKTNRKGLFANMDSYLLEEQNAAYVKKFNGGAVITKDKAGNIITTTNQIGQLRLAVLKDDGTPMPNAVYTTPNGTILNADGAGVIRFVDEAYLKEEQKAFKQQQEYVIKMTEYAMVSDDACATVVGKSVEEIRRDLASVSMGSRFQKDADGRSLPPSIQEADGTPSVLNILAPTSIVRELGTAKLMAYIKKHMPVVEQMTKSYDDNLGDRTTQ